MLKTKKIPKSLWYHLLRNKVDTELVQFQFVGENKRLIWGKEHNNNVICRYGENIQKLCVYNVSNF